MKNWFVVNPRCEQCGHEYPVKEGAFLGSMAINYGMVVFGVLPLWLLVWKLLGVELQILLYGAVGIAILAPVALYPLAWRIWIWICTDFLKEDNPYEE